MATSEVVRNDAGQFIKGQSGNPAGKPKGRKNVITAMKQDLEIALREHVSPKQVKAIIDKMCQKAVEGDVGAGKLILDKVLTNAKEAEEVVQNTDGWSFLIENITVAAATDRSNKDDERLINVSPQKDS